MTIASSPIGRLSLDDRQREAAPEARPRTLNAAVERGARALLRRAHAGRPWGAPDTLTATDPARRHLCAELEGDSILSSEYILMKWILGQERDTPDQSRGHARALERIAKHLRMTQRGFGASFVARHGPAEEAEVGEAGEAGGGKGGWGQYPGSPTDLSATVKAYFALKLAGDDPNAPHMAAARALVLRLGGAERINTFSMFYLACLGQVTWDACPAIPPQIVLLPRWFPFHLDKVAAWTRTMILPLALCTALRPVRTLPPELGIDELFVDASRKRRLCKDIDPDAPASLANLFIVADKLVKVVDKAGLLPMRARALKDAEAWIVRRMDPSTTEGLGAIFPPMVYVQVAFKALGYRRDDPVLRRAEEELDAFMIDAPSDDPRLDHIRLQPCFSPVWDTGIGLYALTEAGLTAANTPRVRALCDWLLERQVRMNGDWERNLRPEDRGLRLGEDTAAWAFEYRNDWYPDVDDTAMVAKALWRAGGGGGAGSGGSGGSGERSGRQVCPYREAASRACRWILAMQNDDGGWAAFDRTKDRAWMESVPFADHNAMQDPSCPDITGRVLEALITCGTSREHAAVRAGVRYILAHQRPEGPWFGRWGVNYLYGTWQAVGGLVHAGVSTTSEPLLRARRWLLSVQKPDGSFGESPNSYLSADPSGIGPATASQTAWGLLTLLALTGPDHPAVQAAASWLMEHQVDPLDNTSDSESNRTNFDPFVLDPAAEDLWREPWYSGTGFPKVFYLRYHMYREYFPVLALARYRRLSGGGRDRDRVHSDYGGAGGAWVDWA